MAAGMRSATIIASWPAPLDMRCTTTPLRAIARSSPADERRIHRNGRLVQPGVGCDVQLAPRGDRPSRIDQPANRLPSHVIVRMPDVEARDTPARDHIGGARPGLDLSHRRDQAGCPMRLRFDGHNPLRRTGDRIMTRVHGRRAGVVGGADKGDIETALSGDRLDDRQRQAETIEHRPLFDVELEVAGQRLLRRARLPAGRGRDRNGEWRPARSRRPASRRSRVSSSSVPMKARLPMNGTPKRTPSSSEKPTISMLKGKRQPWHRSTSATPITTPRMPSNAPARGTVSRWEPMKSCGASRRSRGTARSQVSRGVDADRHAELFHPRGEARVDLAHRRREKRPRRAAGLFGALRESATPADDVAGARRERLTIHGRCCSHTGRAAAGRDSARRRRRYRRG